MSIGLKTYGWKQIVPSEDEIDSELEPRLRFLARIQCGRFEEACSRNLHRALFPPVALITTEPRPCSSHVDVSADGGGIKILPVFHGGCRGWLTRGRPAHRFQ